jgi:hypothetical protein
MKYFNRTKKQMLPNKNIDKLMIELHRICKKHKMVLTSSTKSPLLVSAYSKKSARLMLNNIQNGLEKKEDEEDDKDKDDKKDV